MIPSNEQVDAELDRFRPTSAFNSAKPPLGLRPRRIADNLRAIEIHEAIGRALTHIHIQPIPSEWIDEFVEIINRYPPKP